jgi:hypothetical protein
MTPAERKALSRANKKQKLKDRQRRDLIAKLMTIYKRQQSDVIVIRHDRAGAEDRRGQDRALRSQYLSSLIQLSLDELRLALDVQTEIPDSHGRSRDEAMTGGTKIEKVGAATRHLGAQNPECDWMIRSPLPDSLQLQEAIEGTRQEYDTIDPRLSSLVNSSGARSIAQRAH